MMHPTLQAFEEGARIMTRVRRAALWFGVTVLALYAVKTCRDRDNALRAEGRAKFVADSIQRVERAFQYQAEQNLARADRWMAIADSLKPLTEQIPAVITRIVEAKPLPRPALVGDTVRFNDDSIPHVVDHPVAQWIVAASNHITHLETLVRDTIQPAWFRITQENRALRSGHAELLGANVNLDALATSRLAENNLLRRELARTKPSKIGKLARYAAIGGALYVGYRVGRGR